jgi:hypothetical protein
VAAELQLRVADLGRSRLHARRTPAKTNLCAGQRTMCRPAHGYAAYAADPRASAAGGFERSWRLAPPEGPPVFAAAT